MRIRPNSVPSDVLFRPERRDPSHQLWLDRYWHRLRGCLSRPFLARRRWYARQLSDIHRVSEGLPGLDDQSLATRISDLRIELLRHGLRDDLVASAYALISEVSSRQLGMRHFDCQFIGGLTMLRGMVAEMQTGEGKTLTATLAAGVAALAGCPVHVISVNDYLTERDAQSMGPVYRALGLTVGCVIHGMTPLEKRRAYQADITYCTNKEVAFDYLRDRLALQDRRAPLRLQAERLHDAGRREGQLILRGLHFAIVDEADSVLVDEARTPLIISGQTGDDQQQRFFARALDLAGKLEDRQHFRLEKDARNVQLTDEGRNFLREEVARLDPVWKGTIRRESVVCQALVALNCFHKDEHYIVRDGKVQIVDEFTGRIMADRSWEKGLHQLIEVKEGCEVTQQREALARISYQKFFRRYRHLAGMTGTAREVCGELWETYGLPVLPVPANRPVQRRSLPDRIFPNVESKWEAVAARIAELHHQQRPVLVGTRSVAASEFLSNLLQLLGIEHQVLNAKCDKDEAVIVARAGEPGRVTIATNMAGRGTDIHLHDAVRSQEGLHVILTERHEAGRIDRQLFGRCGRQGDPGSHEAMVAIDDPLLATRHASRLLPLVRRFCRPRAAWWQFLARQAIRRTQRRIERYYVGIRRRLFDQDRQRTTLLSFSGRPD